MKALDEIDEIYTLCTFAPFESHLETTFATTFEPWDSNLKTKKNSSGKLTAPETKQSGSSEAARPREVAKRR